MPSSTLYQTRVVSDVGKSTMGASAITGPSAVQLGFAARNRSLTLHGGDFAVASIAVTPTSATLATTLGTQQLTALSKNAAGDALSDPPTSWASSDETKATVSASGLVTGVATGSSSITALQSTGSITSNAVVVTVP